VGCLRTIGEIEAWFEASTLERRRIMADIGLRRQQRRNRSPLL
jgi:predicted Fe-S protein YdhL (DUF1289 family)